jgi:type IV pilus assembly protein PilC
MSGSSHPIRSTSSTNEGRSSQSAPKEDLPASGYRQMGLKPSAQFARRMGTGLRAGLPITRLCEIEAKSGKGAHAQVMTAVGTDVQAGHSLTRSMLNRGRYFSPLLLQMVQVGEQMGRLERVLVYVAEQLEHQLSVRRDLLSSLFWPAFELLAAVGVIGLYLLIQEMVGGSFDIFGLGLTFKSYVALVLLVFAACMAIGYSIYRGWIPLYKLTPLVYRIPKLGGTLQTLSLARFSRLLSMTLDSGLDPARAMKLSLRGTNNDFYHRHTEKALLSIQKGNSLHEAIKATGVFPRDFLDAVAVSEISGTDAESLERLANDYDERSRAAIRALGIFASMAIRLGVMILLAFLVLRGAMNYIGMINDATRI